MADTNGGLQRLKGRSYAETRSAVLDLIRSEGEISRSEIARRSALTEKTISGIVKSLIDSGVIVEAGFAKSTGGKRPVLLRLNDKDHYAVGVTFDVARCLLVVCAIDGTEIGRSELRGTGSEPPAAVLKRIAAALQRLLQRRDIDKTSIVGICVAMGGRRGTPEGWHVNAPWVDLWEPFPTEDELARLTGIPVSRENDANCAALGEYWTTGKSSRDFVTFYLAYGIGCGIVVGGAIYRGASGNAGEIGHTLADPDGEECWCGRRGCLDTVASPRAVTDLIRRTPSLAKACGVTKRMDFGEITGRFEDAVLSGTPVALKLFETTAAHIAGAVLNVVNTLDLNLVTLAGPGFAVLGERYRAVLDERLNHAAFMRDVHPITVRLGAGGRDAAALGAASVVLHRELTPHHSASPL
ncbi:MAG TPA: ROK family transcriptional regulator [Microlunatus sp.]